VGRLQIGHTFLRAEIGCQRPKIIIIIFFASETSPLFGIPIWALVFTDRGRGLEEDATQRDESAVRPSDHLPNGSYRRFEHDPDTVDPKPVVRENETLCRCPQYRAK
jgi:hypothetical protein